MFSIRENLQPLIVQYNRFLNGHFLSDLLQFKGQKGVGNAYISKVFRGQNAEMFGQYNHVSKSISSPSYFGFLKDNIARIVLLNAAERLIVAYQAAPGIIRQGRPSSYSFLFTEIMNDGAFTGTLRGTLLSFVQSSLVLWPAIFLANQNQSGYTGFLSTYLLFDAVLHPIDSIKNYMYSRTIEPQGLRNALASVSLIKLYSGIIPKTVFNIPFASALYSTTQNDSNSWLYWLAATVAFPLQNRKVWAQTSEIAPLVLVSYRGAVPFLLLNYFFAWKLTALFSKEKHQELFEATKQRSLKELGHI